jgi:hypothetical protein
VDQNGHNARDRAMVLGHAKSKEGQTRGYRALRTVCEALGFDPLTVQRLRGDAMRRLQWAWTDEMRRLATSEAAPFPWNPEWDRETRGGPVYEFRRTPITTGEQERQSHDPEERTAA